MPRFHFSTEDGFPLADENGVQLDTVESAEDFAVQVLVETLRENSQLFWEVETFKVQVTDDAGVLLFLLTLGVERSPALNRRRSN